MISGTGRVDFIERSGELQGCREDASADGCPHSAAGLADATGWIALLGLTLVMTLPFALVAWLFS